MPPLELLDISLPNDVPWHSFSFFTWILIALFSFSLLIYIYWFFIMRKQSNKYLVFKQIFEKLESIENAANEGQISNHHLAQEIDLLLKRASKSFLDENALKELNNNKLWFEYLNSQVKRNGLTDEFKRIFIKASYSPSLDYDIQYYLVTVRSYLSELKKNI